MPDDPIRSRPYSTAMACERCVFGRGEHADWCERSVVVMIDRKHGMSEGLAAALSAARDEFDEMFSRYKGTAAGDAFEAAAYSVGLDPAAGPDETAVRYFERQDEGSLPAI